MSTYAGTLAFCFPVSEVLNCTTSNICFQPHGSMMENPFDRSRDWHRESAAGFQGVFCKVLMISFRRNVTNGEREIQCK